MLVDYPRTLESGALLVCSLPGPHKLPPMGSRGREEPQFIWAVWEAERESSQKGKLPGCHRRVVDVGFGRKTLPLELGGYWLQAIGGQRDKAQLMGQHWRGGNRRRSEAEFDVTGWLRVDGIPAGEWSRASDPLGRDHNPARSGGGSEMGRPNVGYWGKSSWSGHRGGTRRVRDWELCIKGS